ANVKKLYLTPWLLVAVAALVAAAAAGIALAAPASPTAPLPPVAVRPDGDADLDAQLEAARKRLELAADEVARLSTQLSGAVIERVMPFEPGHALIGVQLEA